MEIGARCLEIVMNHGLILAFFYCFVTLDKDVEKEHNTILFFNNPRLIAPAPRGTWGGVYYMDKISAEHEARAKALIAACDRLVGQINRFRTEVALSAGIQRPATDPIFLRPIEELELSARPFNALKTDNLFYIGDLVQRSESDLLKIPNMGRRSIDEIKEMLGWHGLLLGMKLEGWPPQPDFLRKAEI